MAARKSKKTLNVENLQALGAERLAELLMESVSGNAAAKRRLRMELVAAHALGEVAREVRKRLTTIARSRSRILWEKLGETVADLETQRRTIAEQVANADPEAALDLIERFLGLAEPVMDRCEGEVDAVLHVFEAAVTDFGAIAQTANADPEVLAERTFAFLCENSYGQFDDMIGALAPALGAEGLADLKSRFVALAQESPPTPREADRRIVGFGGGGPIYADELAAHHRQTTIHWAFKEIADLQGDVDAFIAQYDEKTRKVPAIAAKIAERLLAAGRAEEAWTVIEAVEEKRQGWIPFEWEQARIKVLEALGRTEEAQDFRWACFERALEPEHLRAYLRQLPDFDDIEAEDRALNFALDHRNVHRALDFLVAWPAPGKAAELVIKRSQELNGNHYEILSPAAKALAEKHPLAATILLRAMIDFALRNARSSRYKHAARDLETCAVLANQTDDFGGFDPHSTYVACLKADHGRKTSFWSLVTEDGDR